MASKANLYGIAGILSPLIFPISLYLSISSSPWFSWTGSCLSDLAGPAADAGAASIFNWGLVIAGILLAAFSFGLKKEEVFRTRLGRLGAVLLLLTAVNLALIGMLPEAAGWPHYLVSALFFTLGLASMAVLGASVAQSDPRAIVPLIALLCASAIGSVSIILFEEGCALYETIGFIPMGLFTAGLGVMMLWRGKIHTRTKSLRKRF